MHGPAPSYTIIDGVATVGVRTLAGDCTIPDHANTFEDYFPPQWPLQVVDLKGF